jgi:predicted  nucleic acid-binding Zn-ribbon protein
MPESQAKAQIEVIREVIEDKLATRRDVKELEMAFRQDIRDVRTELKELEYRLTIRLGGMMAASIAIVAALVKMT